VSAPADQRGGSIEPRGLTLRRARYFREWSVAVALVVLWIVLAVTAPAFFDWQPLLSRLARETPTLIVACGMALVIICRQIDVSVGSQFAVCSVCAGTAAANGLPLFAVVLVAIAGGVMQGAINGFLVAFLGLPSIVVTLATMVIGREGLRWVQQGEFINLPDGMQWFRLGQTEGQCALVGIGLALVAVVAFATRHVAAGRFIYAVGSNAEAARLAGLRPSMVTFFTFVAMGAFVGTAAFLNMAQAPQVDPKSGTGLELAVIAATVIGGVAISGGRGSLWGVAAGVMLLATINPALTYLHVEAYWGKAIQGMVILLAIMADGLRNRAMRSSQ
jgi:rhamnose transport system permease protein